MKVNEGRLSDAQNTSRQRKGERAKQARGRSTALHKKNVRSASTAPVRIRDDSIVKSGSVDNIPWVVIEHPKLGPCLGYVRLPKGHSLLDYLNDRANERIVDGTEITYGPDKGRWIGVDCATAPYSTRTIERMEDDVTWIAQAISKRESLGTAQN